MTTTAGTVPDVKATTGIHQHLHDHRLLPDEHYLDSGYPSAETVTTAATRHQVTMVTPTLLDRLAPVHGELGVVQHGGGAEAVREPDPAQYGFWPGYGVRHKDNPARERPARASAGRTGAAPGGFVLPDESARRATGPTLDG